MITIRLNTDDQAMQENFFQESARILRDIANKFENETIIEHDIFDINGNKIGRITMEDC